MTVVGTGGVRVFLRREWEAGVAKALMRLECPLSVALRPEHLPHGHAFGRRGRHELLNVTAHVFDVERERTDIPAVLPLRRVDGHEYDLLQPAQRLDQDAPVALARRHVPRS